MAPKIQVFFIITSLIVKNIPTPLLTFTDMLRSPCLDQGHGSVYPQLAKIKTPSQFPDSLILLATVLEASLRIPENSWRECHKSIVVISHHLHQTPNFLQHISPFRYSPLCSLSRRTTDWGHQKSRLLCESHRIPPSNLLTSLTSE